MENNKSDLTNPHSAEKARAEDLSGLYPVFEELSNGVDIQPLDDIKEEVFIPFEDKTAFEKEENEYHVEAEKKKTGKGGKILRYAVIAAALCAVVLAGYNIFVRFNDFAHSASAVYQKGDKVEVLLDNRKTFEIEDVVDARLSSDGNYLIYSQNSTSKTGKYDLRLIEMKKRSSVKNKGTLAVRGADEGWKPSSDGAYIYYTVTQEDKPQYFAYIAEKKDSEPVAFNASSVFIPPNGDIVYFTRESGQNTQLYKMRIGEKADVIDKVSGVKAFSDDKVQEIFYTVKNDDESYKLYKISGGGEPLEIAEDVSEVYLDDYTVGGNLYYFVKSESKLNWSDFIADDYAYSDAELKSPQKEDYTYTVGFIFKREKFDESAYNLALQKYEKKQLRDSIRQALNQADLGLAVSSEYKVKVFSKEESKELAGGVRLENLLAFSKTGMPRIIVKRSGINTGNKISMDTLYNTAVSNSVEQAVDYAFQTLRSGGYEMSYGCKYIYCNSNNIYEYDFNPQYSTDSAELLFGSKNSIFAAVKSDDVHYNIYYSKVDGDSISQEKSVAEGVTSFETADGCVYFTVASQDINNDLYVCYPDGSNTCISENTVQHSIQNDSVIVLRAQEDEAYIKDADLLIFKDGRTEEIERGVYYKDIVLKNDKIAYIKDFRYSYDDKTDSSGGTMVIYADNKKTEAGRPVSRIFDIN